jgi:hypothetical protein
VSCDCERDLTSPDAVGRLKGEAPAPAAEPGYGWECTVSLVEYDLIMTHIYRRAMNNSGRGAPTGAVRGGAVRGR